MAAQERGGPFVYPAMLRSPETPDHVPKWISWHGVRDGIDYYLEMIFSCGRKEAVDIVIGDQVAITANELTVDLAWFNGANAELGIPTAKMEDDFIFVPVKQICAQAYPGIMSGMGEIDTHIVHMKEIAQEHRQWQEHLHGPCPFVTVLPETYNSLKCIAALMPDPAVFLQSAEWALELSDFAFLEHLELEHEFPGYPGPLPGIPRLYKERLYFARNAMKIVGDNLFYLKHVTGLWKAYEHIALAEEVLARELNEEPPNVMTRKHLDLHMAAVVRTFARRNAAIIRLERRFMQATAAHAGQDILTLIDISHITRPDRRPRRQRHYDAAATARATLNSQAYPWYHGMRFLDSPRSSAPRGTPTSKHVEANAADNQEATADDASSAASRAYHRRISENSEAQQGGRAGR